MAEEIKWDKIADGFPIQQEYIWLNNAGISTPHHSIVNHVASGLKTYSCSGYLSGEYDYYQVKERIKNYLSELLQCNPDEVGLIHNTAEGMNFAAHGVRLSENDEVLVLEKEYPSNVYPWFSLHKQGVRVRFIPISVEHKTFLDSVKNAISDQTKLISMSAVDWLTGISLPLKEIGELCVEKNIIFVVDAAQGLGHIRLHPKECHISFLCGSAWKWLLGPVGLGYLYISNEFIDQIEPVFWGTDSVIDSENYLPYKKELKPGADRFCYSSPSYLDWLYFYAALDFLNSIGFENVRERILTLSDLLRKKILELGFDVFAQPINTGIISMSYPKETNSSQEKLSQLHKKCKEKKIVTALRDHRIRLSPHIMNTESQINECVNIIRQMG